MSTDHYAAGGASDDAAVSGVSICPDCETPMHVATFEDTGGIAFWLCPACDFSVPVIPEEGRSDGQDGPDGPGRRADAARAFVGSGDGTVSRDEGDGAAERSAPVPVGRTSGEGDSGDRSKVSRWGPETTRRAVELVLARLDEYELPRCQRIAVEYTLGKMYASGFYEVGNSGSEMFGAGELSNRWSGEDALTALARDREILKRTMKPRMRSNQRAQMRRQRAGRRRQYFYRLVIPGDVIAAPVEDDGPAY